MNDLDSTANLTDQVIDALIADIWLAAGVPVFPCNPADKRPLTAWRRKSVGRPDRTVPMTLDDARDSWRRPGRDRAMAGLDCESVRVVVVDCDIGEGVNGVEAFERLALEAGFNLEAVPQVETPRGGRHYYFADPHRRFRNTAGALAPGVDTRGVGGFVVGPGAQRADGRRYEPLNPADLHEFVSVVAQGLLPPLPESLAARLARPSRLADDSARAAARAVPSEAAVRAAPPALLSAISLDVNDDLGAGLAKRWTLEAACAEIMAAAEGQRNDMLNRHAYIAGLVSGDAGPDRAQTLTALVAAAIQAGLPGNEAARTSGPAYARGAAGAAADAQADEHAAAESNGQQVAAPFMGGVYSPQQALAMMNARYAIVLFNNSGEVAIVRHSDGEQVVMREQDIKLELSNVRIIQNVKKEDKEQSEYKPIYQWWRDNKQRDPTRREIFDPKRPSGVACGPYEFNFWRGFGVEPVEGTDKIQKLCQHIWEIICKKDKTKRNYLMRWLAWIVQNPGQCSGVAIVLRSSTEGPGKSLLGELMVRIFGAHGLTISDPNQLFGDFNGHLEFACLVLIEEALLAGDPRIADRIKSRLTSDAVLINPKFHQARTVPNRMNALINTNHEWAVPAGAGARRLFVAEVSEERVGDQGYFDAIHADLRNGGDGQFLNLLRRVDLKGWHPRNPPRTTELAHQQLMSLTPVARWLWECANSECILGGRNQTIFVAKPDRDDPAKLRVVSELGGTIDAPVLRDAFNEWAQNHSLRTQSEAVIGKELVPILGSPRRKSADKDKAENKARPRYYFVPESKELKQNILDAKRIAGKLSEIDSEELSD
jgi:hypothetical protein